MSKKTIRDIEVAGKKALVRVDFNVPLNDKGEVTDDTRIRFALPTINYLRENGARVILMSHLGRPKGKFDEKLKMDPVATRLQELLGASVTKVDDCVGDAPRKAVDNMKDGDVVLLENLRFHEEEKKNDGEFSRRLAELGDIYINDAFGTAHRAHASTSGITAYLPGVAGFLLEKEIKMLGKVVSEPDRPLTAVIGGAKVSDKIGVLDNLMNNVDTLLIGGGMANTFLAAQGYDMKNSLVEEDKIENAKELIAKAENNNIKMILPVDLTCGSKAESGAEWTVMPVSGVPDGWMALDIGTKTLETFSNEIKASNTVVWNGPMGMFEVPPFDRGTVQLAEALTESGGNTIVGGGDSVSAVEKAGVSDRISHISTGGGASLEFLEGRTLPGIAALQDK